MARHIRVLHSSTKGKADFLETLKDNDNQYEQRILALKNFRSQSKQKVNTRNYIQEWTVEQQDLIKALDRHEKIQAECLQALLLAGLDVGTIESLVSEEEELKQTRRMLRRGYDQQLRDLRRFLADQSKQLSKATQPNNKGGGKEEERPIDAGIGADADRSDRTAIISAICADVFLKMRFQFSDQWTALQSEEESLRREIQHRNQQLSSMLREEALLSQNQALQDELLSLVNGSDADLPADDPNLLELLTSITQQIADIDQQYQSLNARKMEELQQVCTDIGLDISENSGWAMGGWTSAEHDTFAKVYRNAEVKGTKRSRMLQQLQMQLPSRSQDELLQHEEWHRSARRIKARHRETEKQLTVARQEIISNAKNSVSKLKSDRLEALEREAEMAAHEEKRKLLRDQLESMRAEKLLLEHEKSLQEAMQQSEKAARDEEKDLLLQAEREKKKRLVEEYLRQKVAMEEEHRRQQEAAEAAAAEHMRSLIEANKGRIEFRAQQFDQKQLQKRQKEEELLRQEQRRIDFLRQLAATVPYWTQVQEAVSKLDHMTTAVKGHEYVQPEELTRGHMPLNSFANHEIIRDARFRLAEALARANIQHSEAARQAVQQFHPRPHLAIHGLL